MGLSKINAAPDARRQETAMTDAELVARYDGRVPRYTSYPTAPHFSPAVEAETYAKWLGALPPAAPLSLYLHVPFCDRLCYYCGCNTTVVRLDSSLRAYAGLLEREIERVAGLIGHKAKVSHVHWGGGTPTSLPGDRLVEAMARLRESFAFEPDAEIAIELDPTSLPKDRLDALRQMGVTRVSLGVQDLEPAVQDAIGRRQSYEETEDCAAKARGLGVGSLNLDLIYGLPLQTEESVARTARRALDLAADRVAVFGYAHVPWMKKHQQLIPEETLPGPAARFAQQRAIHNVLVEEGGYLAVGLDHYARPGDAMAEAAASRRLKRGFQGYTTDAAPALIGFGASAIGSLPDGYVQNAPTAPAYAKLIEAGGLAAVRGASLTKDDRLRRDVIERLMCDLEVDIEQIAKAHAADPAPLLACLPGLARFEADGLAHWDGRRIQVSEQGRPFVRSVAALFDAYLTQDADKPRHSRAV
jgi:oxygen-independent coproporphyrinogen-3 oxidase